MLKYLHHPAATQQEAMEAEKMICYWTTCGKPLSAKPGSRFVRCSECGHLTCLPCKATHEGMSCATFQAERRPAGRSPARPPSPLGARRKSCGTTSPWKDARSIDGDKAPSRVSPPPTLVADFDAMTLQTPPGHSWANASASASSAGPSHYPNVTAQSTSPSKQSAVADGGTWSGDPGTSRQMRKAICRTEDCGFEKQVDASDTELICYKCRKTTCLVCNAIHSYLSCEEYRRQLDDQEEEIQVWCAGKDCKFTAYVGASTLQLTCPLCGRITCIKCQAVHEFQTCEAYAQLNQIFEEIVDVLGCGHLLCRECVHATAVGSLTYIVHCPVTTEEGVSCGSCIQESALISVMTEDEYTLRKGLLNLPIIRCPTEGCSGKFSARPGTQRMNCPACQSEYCVPCSAIHSGITCEQFIRGVVDDVDGPDVADILSSGLSASPLPSTPETSDEEAVECSGCLADTPAEDVVTVEQCGHRLCRDCIRRNTIDMTGNAALCPVKLEDDTQCNSRIQGSAL
ncbi:hypothetical protein MTO96_032061 [Rhipicephalus appendiculatus]